MKNYNEAAKFMKPYLNLTEVLTDHKLAALGDAYINFAYSLALSAKRAHPSGDKVKGTILAEALRKAELRKHMPSRMTSHKLADAAEALIVYGWLENQITLEETVSTIEKTDDSTEGFTRLLKTIKSRIRLS
jgi:hypothetical protein